MNTGQLWPGLLRTSTDLCLNPTTLPPPPSPHQPLNRVAVWNSRTVHPRILILVCAVTLTTALYAAHVCQTVLREGSLVRDFRRSGNPIALPPYVWALCLPFLFTSTSYACLCYSQSLVDILWLKYSTMNKMRPQNKTKNKTKTLWTKQTLAQTDDIVCVCVCDAVKLPISMLKPVNVGRWHHSAWVQETSDSHVSSVICFPVDKSRNVW